MNDIINLPNFKFNSSQQELLVQYTDFVLFWNKKTDLISKHDCKNFLSRHVYNSIQLLSLFDDSDQVIHDIGSGAGLPGIVCALIDSKQRSYTLFEKKYQKRSFLINMKIEFNLSNVEVIGKYPDVSRETSDVITSRGLLSLSSLFEYRSLFKKFILFKGRGYLEEIKKLKDMNIQHNISTYKHNNDDSYFIAGNFL